MASCHDMRINEIYQCTRCGLELKVVKECHNKDIPEDQCTCHDAGESCALMCCGLPLAKKA